MAKRVHPEAVGVLRVAHGDMPGNALGEVQPAHGAQPGRQALFAVQALRLDVLDCAVCALLDAVQPLLRYFGHTGLPRNSPVYCAAKVQYRPNASSYALAVRNIGRPSRGLEMGDCCTGISYPCGIAHW